MELRMAENEEEIVRDKKSALDVAALAGHILLESGAEIFRVEETIERIANAYGLKGDGAFVLSSGIFLTEEIGDHSFYARVRHIPLNATHLERVAAVNQLSREITSGRYSIEEAYDRLLIIQTQQENTKKSQVFAYGLGSACFCYLFGGSVYDSMAAFLAGCILALFLFLLGARKKQTSKMVMNVLGGMVVSTISILLYSVGVGQDLNHMMIGSIIPLLPGVAFTNAIRDFANEDYISGAVRMVDAILVAVCIAVGVGFVYSISYRISGGLLG